MNVTVNSLYLYITSLVPSPEEQHFLNESFMQSFTLSFDPSMTDRKRVKNGKNYQVDIGSASNINIPLYLIAAHQKTQRDNHGITPNQFNNSFFDNFIGRRFFIEIDGIRYPKDPIEINYPEKYLNHYRDLKLFYKEFTGQSSLNPFIRYLDMKTFYPIQVSDLRFQIEYETPKRSRLF